MKVRDRAKRCFSFCFVFRFALPHQDHQNHLQDQQNHGQDYQDHPSGGAGGPGGGSAGPGDGSGGPGGVKQNEKQNKTKRKTPFSSVPDLQSPLNKAQSHPFGMILSQGASSSFCLAFGRVSGRF